MAVGGKVRPYNHSLNDRMVDCALGHPQPLLQQRSTRDFPKLASNNEDNRHADDDTPFPANRRLVKDTAVEAWDVDG